MSKRKRNKPIISKKEMEETAVAYADCFSKDRDSPVWKSAFDEHIINCNRFNEFIKGTSK